VVVVVLFLLAVFPTLAENCAVAAQQKLLARADLARLELPASIHQPNAREFPASRKRKMTVYEAAIQEELEALVRHCREAIQAQEDEGYRLRYREDVLYRLLFASRLPLKNDSKKPQKPKHEKINKKLHN
jgi:hypothetical protein